MRIATRNQICEILSTVYAGVEYAMRTDTDAETASAVLEAGANAIAVARGKLEDQLSRTRADYYCKRLDAATAGLDNITEKAGEILNTLSVIYDDLAVESEVKLEVAFFPYNASMWDSLESIWLAARDDERCNATVVPIRYFTLTPDSSAVDVHYDRDIFPDYVPVVRFEDYNPASKAPDIAYIHNPYDNRNSVTSVDPAYYSFKLKKHVGTLVYVPYYLSSSKTGDVFVNTTLDSSADIIIALSDEDAKNMKDRDPARDFPALGSPKVDRILRFEREIPDMPPQWREKLDGKKVFLLNTSIAALLRHTDKFIKKMNLIFDIFANRNNAALLWRPHPLLGATLTAMLPSLHTDYTELTRRIHEIGVLDETSDVTRAIALSDGYIGEGSSSLFSMYGITGKPMYLVMPKIIRRLEDTERDEVLRSIFITALISKPGGSSALALSLNTNEICRIDLQTGCVTPVTDIPGVGPEDVNPYLYIADCGDKYILPPHASDSFIELDREFKLIRKVELPEEAKADAVFAEPVRHGDYVYFLPFWSRTFARYSVKTGEYEYYYDWYEEFSKYAEKDDPAMFSGSYCTVGNKLYLPCCKDNIVTELDFETMKVTAYFVGPNGYRYHSITHDGEAFWLTLKRPPAVPTLQWNSSIVRWDIKTGKVSEYHNFPEGFEPGVMGFSRILYDGTDLLVFPYTGNMILKVNRKSGEISEFCEGTITSADGFMPAPISPVFSNAGRFENGMLWGIMARERALLMADTASGGAKKVPLRFDTPRKPDVQMANQRFMQPKHSSTRRGAFIESTLFPPEEFIDRVVSGKITDNPEQSAFYLGRISNSDGTSGAKIHEYVMNKTIEKNSV